MTGRHLHLNAFLMSTGHHEASWRLPESNPYAGTDIGHYIALARIAERGTFDSLFLADSPQLNSDPGRRPVGVLEPLTLLTVLAGVTERIGLIATASTSYNSPYNLARRLASLDHVSNGRAGWNIVTSATREAARNFGLSELPDHASRYARADEFVRVTQKLWDSWEDDAIIADKSTGVWGDSSRIHPAHHHGEYYFVDGPLNIPRSPQGHPLLVQAGSSEAGKVLAARYADAVFTAQQTVDEARDFYNDVKSRAAAAGRERESVKILPGIVPVIGSTEEQARAKERELTEAIVPDYAHRQLAGTLGVPIEDLPLDAQLPANLPGEDAIEGGKSRYSLIVELARRERLTVRTLIGRLGGGRGHLTITGTPEQIAETIIEWFQVGAADGFNVMGPVLPSGLELFVDHVVPILRARGVFRTEYEAQTLRGHYGLAQPAPRRAQPVAVNA
ncbi:MAG: LLM class flavin-dependent oxidoreductase [Gordonia sp. (in: high G+C Gram-positive bacteria)]